ncbi:MAG: S9 family peptidase [Acidobacteria bacterium]|nr:S9 family peptidase [Acidobacteriota bacterium]MBV9476096.1 S9 family peptidase [Acidobacteriota bacterium]
MKRLVLLSCLVAALASAQPHKRPMSIDDQFRVVEPGNPQLSPDGQWVLYTIERIALDENARHATTWLASSHGDPAAKLFLAEGDRSPMWAPDSKSVFFTRKGQLFEQRVGETSAIQHSHIDGEVPWSWQLARGGASLLAIRSDEHPAAPGATSDVAFVDEGSNGQTRVAWDNLYRYDLKTETLTRVTQRAWSIDSADLAPDGRRAVVAARPDNGRNTRWKTELFVVDLASGTTRQLTHNAAPESTPRWSPDGTWILFNAVRLDRWELGNGDFWRVDVATGTTQLLTPKRTGRFSGTPFFSPDGKSIFTQSGYGTARFPVRVDVATGAIAPLLATHGSARASSWSADARTFAYTYQDFATPPELYIGNVDDRGERQHRITDLNAWISNDLALGSVQLVHWKSVDGLRIEGLLYLPPPELAVKKPLPLIVHLPCGPGCGWTNTFATKNQVYAGLGYAQLSVVVRGSSNYDDAFIRANKFDLGGGDRRDAMTGVDAMIARGIADPHRLAVDGWSYGAILGGYTLTKTNRFRAASLGAMVSDWIADYGSVAYYSNERWFIGGNPWSNPDAWRERSSLTHADRVHTPTLLHHGDLDTSCAPFQSMNFFVALRRFGRTARLIRYPDEEHDLRQPAHLRLRDAQDVAWMQWFVRGIRSPELDGDPSTLVPIRDSAPAAPARGRRPSE